MIHSSDAPVGQQIRVACRNSHPESLFRISSEQSLPVNCNSQVSLHLCPAISSSSPFFLLQLLSLTKGRKFYSLSSSLHLVTFNFIPDYLNFHQNTKSLPRQAVRPDGTYVYSTRRRINRSTIFLLLLLRFCLLLHFNFSLPLK